MSLPEAAATPQNQIAFPFMSEGEAGSSAAAAAADKQIHMASTDSLGIMPVAAVVGAIGLAVLSMFASGATEPFLLTILAALAMIGVFFTAALVMGYLRFSDRAREGDLASAVCSNVGVGLLVTAPDGTIAYANGRVQAMGTGIASGRAVDFESLFAGDVKAGEALFRLHRAAARGEAASEEMHHVPPGRPGERRSIRVTCRPLPRRPDGADPAGATPMVLWTLTDVTDERALDEGRVQALESALSFTDTAPVGLVATQVDGTIRYLNATFANWLGVSRGGKRNAELNLVDIISVGGQALLNGALRRTGGAAASVDLDVTCEDGRVLPMRFVARRTHDGMLIAASSREKEGASDLSGGPAVAGATRFFQSAPFGIATVAADGRIANANAAFARITSEIGSNIAGQATEVLCRNAETESRAAFDAALRDALLGRASPPVELTIGADRQVTVRVYISPLSVREGAREAAVLYVIDATEEKALEAKFAQSSKMEAVGNLAGGIAHDFNNVLTAIIGFSDLLLQTHRPTDAAYKDISNIRSSAVRAAGLVAKLLAFSRRQTFQSEPLHMGEVLSEMSNLLRRTVGEKIELKTPPARDLWYVKADKTQIDQVLINLTVNAKDAMPDGGAITIRTRNVTERDSQRESRKPGQESMVQGEYVIIEVEDTGTGMSPEVRAKIFEPFFTTKGVGKGTGLGLATVYGIVKQSGGYIFVDSEEGRGTTFRVYLPRYMPDNEDELIATKAPKKEAPKDLTGYGRVLLVEDEDFVRSFAVRALTRLGYEVLEASTGVEALEIMAANDGRVDLVVSDVVMPEMDGPTLLKELRRTNPALKIIFVSGYPNEAFETALDKDEEFAFLPKPFSMPQLAAKVKDELAR
jgi:two-component system cell cycle sensor histidine kinase/response regulator CckA